MSNPQLREEMTCLMTQSSERSLRLPQVSKVGMRSSSTKLFFFLAMLGLRGYVQAFSSCSEWGLLFVAVHGLPIVMGSLVAEHGLQAHGLQQLWHVGSVVVVHGFSSCGSRVQQLQLVGSRAQAQQLWRTGLVAPQHVGSSWARDRTRVPCIGSRTLNHCATREAPQSSSLTVFKSAYHICPGGRDLGTILYFSLRTSFTLKRRKAIYIYLLSSHLTKFPIPKENKNSYILRNTF